VDPEINNFKPFRFNDPRQARIYRRLLLIGPGAAAFYQDACRLMSESNLVSTTHLVSHLLREIESSLRNVLKPFIKSEEKPKGEIHTWQIREILKGLNIPESDSIAIAWLQIPGGDYGLHKRAHREDLAAPRPFNEDYSRFWVEMENILDSVLEKFETHYLEAHRMLDEFLQKAEPTNEDTQWLRLYTPNNQVSLGYFFNNLNNSKWLKPLISEGLFKHPPEPQREPKDGRILFTYSPWAQSRYLVRMAALEPLEIKQMVFETMMSIETENFLIHLDIIDVACFMLPRPSAKLALKEIPWIEAQNWIDHLLPEKLALLINHLTSSGETEVALQLAQILLNVFPDPKAIEYESRTFLLQPRPKMDLWDYERIINKCRIHLANADGLTTLVLFTNLLETAIKFSHPSREITGKEDHSEIWRQGIEGYEDGLRNLLVSAVRDTAEQIVESDPGNLISVVEYLESRTWLIFKRIALYLLRIFPEDGTNLIAERLTNKLYFDERELWHEYILLAKENFSRLHLEQQNTILNWIDESPGIEAIKKNAQEWDGQILTDEQAEQRIKWRKLRLLEPLREVLPSVWKKRYDDWTAELGTPEHTEYVMPPIQFHMGYGSPQSTDDLRSMSVSEIVAFLTEWKPNGKDPLSASPEGLGRELAPLVSLDPEHFAAHAEAFQNLDPTYVRAFITGIKGALNQSAVFSWAPVLRLCNWVLKQPIEITERESRIHQDANWTSTRSEIADLIGAGLKSETGKIPLEFRSEVWDVIKELTSDPEPTPEYEDKYGGDNMDPLTLSMNTVRGEAMRSLIHYVLWAARKVEINDSKGPKEEIVRGFDDMPEVRATLELHLDLNIDPSLAVRAVYGQYLAWLIWFDKDWVEANLEKIFPKEESLLNHYSAAWGTYMFGQPTDDSFELLLEVYKRAIELIGSETVYDKSHLTHPDKRLVYHLIAFYLRDRLSLEDAQGLLNLFYEKASDELRAYVFSSIGRDFRNAETVESEVLEKIKKLVEFRVATAQENPSAKLRSEMKNFGWLFASKKFDDDWSLATLKQTLEIAGYSEFDDIVVEHLADLAVKYPTSAITCLNIMTDDIDNPWKISHWNKHIRKIISEAVNTESRDIARALINKLGSRGSLEFQDLLPNQ
jgi:hypothetical protein